jgi:hypothetical protein
METRNQGTNSSPSTVVDHDRAFTSQAINEILTPLREKRRVWNSLICIIYPFIYRQGMLVAHNSVSNFVTLVSSRRNIHNLGEDILAT